MTNPLHKLVERYGSPGVPFLALALIEYGALLLLLPHRFTGDAFGHIFFFEYSKPVWGMSMIVAGIIGLLFRNQLGVFILMLVALTWGLALLWVVILGVTSGPGGWVWPLNFACAVAYGIRRKGFRGDR